PHEGPHLHAVARAVAEARAREYGVSLSDYVSDLILTAHNVGGLAEGSHIAPWGMPVAAGRPRQLDLWKGASDTIENHGIASHEPDLWDRGSIVAQASLTTAARHSRPALELIALFNDRIQYAALLLSAAFVEAAVCDFTIPSRHGRPARAGRPTW